MAHETAFKDVYSLFKTALVDSGYEPQISTCITYFFSWDSAVAQIVTNGTTGMEDFLESIRTEYGDSVMILNRCDDSTETYARALLLYWPRGSLTTEVVIFGCHEIWDSMNSQADRLVFLATTGQADDLYFVRTFLALFKDNLDTIQFEQLPHGIDIIKARAEAGIFTTDGSFSDADMAAVPELTLAARAGRDLATHTTGAGAL